MNKFQIYLIKFLLTSFFVSSVAINFEAADYQIPREFMNQNWTETGNVLPEGWSTWGTDKEPAGVAETMFEKGDGWKIIMLPGHTNPVVASYSSFVGSGNVSTGLATPLIKVPEVGGMMSFSVLNYNPDGSTAAKLSVYVEETEDKSDEWRPKGQADVIKRVSPNAESPVEIIVPLNDYAGKEVRIAFVNEASQCGITAIAGIEGFVYKADLISLTPLNISPGRRTETSLATRIISCVPQINVSIEIAGKQDSKSVTVKTFEMSEWNLVQFGALSGLTESYSYTYSVAPAIEGIEPLSLSQAVVISEGYSPICVIEDATGETCGYCPAGAAAIQKFTDEYPDRVVGIAVHCTYFSTGVMENPDYSQPFLSSPLYSVDGLPAIVINRSVMVPGTEFAEMDNAVAAALKSPSVAHVKVDRVDCDMQTGHVDVSFSTSVNADVEGLRLNAAVALTADDLTGNSIKWYQSDYYSGTSEEGFVSKAPASWWPYMKFWCEYPSTKVSPTDMTFNHVAMGIYPDFNGSSYQLTTEWKKGIAENGTISFDMPMQTEENGFGVQDIEKTSVVVLILNPDTGDIVTAAKVNATDYNRELSAIQTIESDSSSEVVSCRWFNLDGVPVNQMPTIPGLYIRLDSHSDGSVTSSKVIVR